MILMIVGVIYLCSGLWCFFNVDLSAEYLGFFLGSDTAKSEFMTVYGGLQLGLALSMMLGARLSFVTLGVTFMAMVVSIVLALIRFTSIFVYPDASPEVVWPLFVLELCLAIVLTIAYVRTLRSAR